MVKLKTAPLWISLLCSLFAVSIALDPANWMRENMHLLGKRTLKQICIPGTHNSGMIKLTGGTAFAKECNTLNQSRNIREQLDLGVRFFDIRPVISGRAFKTGHYGKITGGIWQGGNGENIETIVEDINNFTKDKGELIIVFLSHTLNTDVGTNYRVFDEEEWNRLFQLLDKTEYRLIAPGDDYIPGYTLGNMTDNGNRSAVVYVVSEKRAKLGDRLGQGYFYFGNIQIYDKYSDSNQLSSMVEDQISKMKQVSANRYFLLSWTLTQKPVDATTCPLGASIDKLAKRANKEVWKIMPEVSEAAYPNIIYVDYVENQDFAVMAMAINNKLRFK